MFHIADLLSLADEFIRAAPMAAPIKEVTLSYRVFGDSKKLKMLRQGSDITVRSFNAALVWFSVNWPDGAEWPADVARPTGEPSIEAAE